MTHPNSRKVYFRRCPLTVHESDPNLKEYFAGAHRTIDSYWSQKSVRPGTGLTLAEEDLLMPRILDLHKEDREYRKKSTEYFHAITTKVPDGTGVELEIGLLKSNDEPLSEDNLPINPVDYVKYRHGISHPWVAMSLEESKGNKLKKFYLYDPNQVKKNTVSSTDLKDMAMTAYLQVRQDPVKVNQYLMLLGVMPYAHEGQEVLKLRELAETKPRDFLLVHKDPQKNAKFLLAEMIAAKAVEEVGTRIIITQSKEQIGATRKEALAYLTDVANSKQVAIFKSLIQEWKKKKKVSSLKEIEAGDETISVNL